MLAGSEKLPGGATSEQGVMVKPSRPIEIRTVSVGPLPGIGSRRYAERAMRDGVMPGRGTPGAHGGE